MIPLLVIAGAAVALMALAAALNSSNNNPPATPSTPPCPTSCQFAGALQSVTFSSGIDVAKQNNTVPTPHWILGTDVSDGSGSQRAAVYCVNGIGSHDVIVVVNVTQSINCAASADLVGTIADLTIRGTLSTGAGMQTVGATITNPPDRIKWYQGDIAWQAVIPGCGTFSLGSTRAEIFIILDVPPFFYQPHGVWVEVLRLLCSRASVLDMWDKKTTAARVTHYAHWLHGLAYDTVHGASSYSVGGQGGVFDLARYLSLAASRGNCYDQAAAVQVFSGALGVAIGWNYIEPFGYLKQTHLVGIGQCNNPFFDSNHSSPVLGPNDPQRTSFGNHAFCQFQPDAPASGGPAPPAQILDACAGPHLATEDLQGYITAGIDTVLDTTRYGTDLMNNWNIWAHDHPADAADPARAANAWAWFVAHNHPGTVADVHAYSGVTWLR